MLRFETFDLSVLAKVTTAFFRTQDIILWMARQVGSVAQNVIVCVRFAYRSWCVLYLGQLSLRVLLNWELLNWCIFSIFALFDEPNDTNYY